MKIAVIGDSNSVKGFLALGLDVYETDQIAEAKKILNKLSDGIYAVIYITESLFSDMLEDVERFNERISPAIIPIPGIMGNTGIGKYNVSKSVERAVGSDIIGDV